MHNLIKYLIIFLSVFSLLNASGQKYKKPQNLPRYDYKKLHFGFTLGINELNFNKVNPNENTSDCYESNLSKLE